MGVLVEGAAYRAVGRLEAAGSCNCSRRCLLCTRQESLATAVNGVEGSVEDVEVLQGKSGSTVGQRLPCLVAQMV
jgi:hypothetical protein